MSGSVSLLATDLLVSVLLDSFNLIPCPYIYVDDEQFNTMQSNYSEIICRNVWRQPIRSWWCYHDKDVTLIMLMMVMAMILIQIWKSWLLLLYNLISRSYFSFISYHNNGLITLYYVHFRIFQRGDGCTHRLSLTAIHGFGFQVSAPMHRATASGQQIPC